MNLLKNTHTWLCILLGGICACAHKDTRRPAPETAFLMPVIIDSTDAIRFRRDTREMQGAGYIPFYIGSYKDTIAICDTIGRTQYPYCELGTYREPASGEMLILIDTAMIIADYAMIWSNLGSDMDFRTLEAYPLIVANVGSDTLQIGYGEHLGILMEAKDRQGHWRPIEKPYQYLCGLGMSSIILPPGQIAISSAPVSQGNFATKLRLRSAGIISPEFPGSIHETQFEAYPRRLH